MTDEKDTTWGDGCRLGSRSKVGRIVLAGISGVGMLGITILGLSSSGFAHEGLHERIRRVSQRLLEDPDDPALWLLRADLHRRHEAWGKAGKDLDRARRLIPKSPLVDLAEGRLLKDQNRLSLARLLLDRALRRDPNLIEAYEVRSEVLEWQGEFLEAAKDLTRCVDRLSHPSVDLYLRRSDLLLRADESHREEALRGLIDAIEKLGPGVPLVLATVDLEVDLGRGNAALGRLQELSKRATRRETWHAREGDLLRRLGRMAEARERYQDARKAIEALPVRLRFLQNTQDLEARVKSILKEMPPSQSQTQVPTGKGERRNKR